MVNDVTGELESYQQHNLLLFVNGLLLRYMLNKLFSHNF